jgi:hypothetical protein
MKIEDILVAKKAGSFLVSTINYYYVTFTIRGFEIDG